MLLGIEIGGTKLQLGVGSGTGPPLVELVRIDVDPEQDAEKIRDEIARAAGQLIERHEIEAVGIGFGGPVDVESGRTITSHQVEGWNDFSLADWCRETFNLPAVVANDSDSAGLAEARFGAGRGHRIVFYTNVGSGIGGALVIDGELFRGGSGVVAELGHLRPGLHADRPDQTLESIASGFGITAAVQARLTGPVSHLLESHRIAERPPEPDEVRQRLIEREDAEERDTGDLLERCDGQVDRLTAKLIAEAALAGNQLARSAFDHACQAFGWGIAQMATLVAPNVVVVGGGVSLVGDELLFTPLRAHVGRYVFPPLDGTFEIVPSQLGEEVVVHGVLALAAGL
ncbi:MAG: ROK family protein [Planctomycetes bacterium]|nr:ROK family protein [Planctomycetota bacterium]